MASYRPVCMRYEHELRQAERHRGNARPEHDGADADLFQVLLKDLQCSHQGGQREGRGTAAPDQKCKLLYVLCV